MDLDQVGTNNGLFARIRTLRNSGAAIHAAAFTPPAIVAAVRMLLALYPVRFRRDRALQDAVLRSFVLTVIPGADADEPDLTRMYHDPDYPFHPYTGFLVWDLERRARRGHGNTSFDRLSPEERTSVIQEGLDADDTSSRLYCGAILMAHVSYYAGIYHADRGCALIGFPGSNTGFSRKELTYPGAELCLGNETTIDGNPP